MEMSRDMPTAPIIMAQYPHAHEAIRASPKISTIRSPARARPRPRAVWRRQCVEGAR